MNLKKEVYADNVMSVMDDPSMVALNREKGSNADDFSMLSMDNLMNQLEISNI